MKFVAIIILHSDSGLPLFSRKSRDIKEDLFSPFLSAIKSFFSNLSLGGLSSFTTEDFTVYLASSNKVLTSVIINRNDSADKYFSLAFNISNRFFKEFQKILDPETIVDTNLFDTKFESILNDVLKEFDEQESISEEIIRIYTIESNGGLKTLIFQDQDELYSLPLVIIQNLVTKEFFILENDDSLPNRVLFYANREISNLNQREFKSQYNIRSITTSWGCEQIINQVAVIFNDLKIHRDIKLLQEKIKKF